MAKMASLSMIFGFLVLFVGIDSLYLNAQQNDNTNQSQQEEKKKEGLVVVWLDDMQNCEDWRSFTTSVAGETGTRKIPGKPRPINENGEPGEGEGDEIVDESGISHKNEYVLGVKGYIWDRGFDRIEVLPPNELAIRGKGKEIKVWVLGRKFRHTLYVKLRDYAGRIYKLKMGRLDFWGWKEMAVVIPPYIPQSARYAVLNKNLRVVSLYVQSDPFEPVGMVYFYLSQLRVTTDFSEFTGDESIKDVW
jgi:hypothetical protein